MSMAECIHILEWYKEECMLVSYTEEYTEGYRLKSYTEEYRLEWSNEW